MLVIVEETGNIQSSETVWSFQLSIQGKIGLFSTIFLINKSVNGICYVNFYQRRENKYDIQIEGKIFLLRCLFILVKQKSWKKIEKTYKNKSTRAGDGYRKHIHSNCSSHLPSTFKVFLTNFRSKGELTQAWLLA